MTDTIIETMARAAFENFALRLPEHHRSEWEHVAEENKAAERSDMQAALKALIEGGWVVVPRVATPEMINAVAKGPSPAERWEAMVSTFLEGDQEGFMASREPSPSTEKASVASDLTDRPCPDCRTRVGFNHLPGCTEGKGPWFTIRPHSSTDPQGEA